MRSLVERFWEKVDKSGDCWTWTAYRNPDGYGVIRTNGESARAHRIAWELEHGPIPDGLSVLHACDNPPCVRHLFLGTQIDNIRDMIAKGRKVNPPKKSHCKSGHEFSQSNTYLWNGEKHCRACRRNADKRRGHRK